FSYASSHSKANRKKNILPEDIFSYNNDLFYEYIKQAYGNDIAKLFSFQAIRNAELLLDTSCEDILLVLQQESDDIDALKKMCCFEVAGNKYQVKLGVKLTINNLIQSLNVTPLNQSQTQDTVTPLESTLSSSLTTNTSSIQSTSSPMQRKLDELGHIADIEERIDRWWVIHDEAERASLEQGIDYFLAITKSLINTYTCALSCKCHTRFKLPFMAPGFFKISSLYRHLKEKQCIQLRPGKENNLVNSEISSSNQSKTLHSVATSSGIESQHVKKAAHTTTSKRIRPQSDRHGVIKKSSKSYIKQVTLERLISFAKSKTNSYVKNYELKRDQLEHDLPDKLTEVWKQGPMSSGISDIPILIPWMKNTFENFKKQKNKFTYDNLIQQFALLLFILGGRNCYEFLRLNLPTALCHVSNVELLMRNNEQKNT
ncbi:unnamed protein product, partial [Rotaria magnacalcarata]